MRILELSAGEVSKSASVFEENIYQELVKVEEDTGVREENEKIEIGKR